MIKCYCNESYWKLKIDLVKTHCSDLGHRGCTCINFFIKFFFLHILILKRIQGNHSGLGFSNNLMSYSIRFRLCLYVYKKHWNKSFNKTRLKLFNMYTFSGVKYTPVHILGLYEFGKKITSGLSIYLIFNKIQNFIFLITSIHSLYMINNISTVSCFSNPLLHHYTHIFYLDYHIALIINYWTRLHIIIPFINYWNTISSKYASRDSKRQ